VANGQSIVAPTLLPYEVTNILRLRTLRGSLPAGQAQPLLAQYLTFPIRLLSPETLHREALRLSESFALPAAYDAHYLALAQLLSCELWTDDRRLLRQLGGKLTFVRAIGEYA
jgi:predicted nucleic acid-binding protein